MTSLLDISPELAVAGVGFAIALVIYAILSTAEDRNVVRQSLKRLDGYEVGGVTTNVRERELEGNLLERIGGPILASTLGLTQRFTPVGYIDGVRRKFNAAGKPQPELVDRFLAIRVLSLLGLPVVLWFMFIWNPLAQRGMMQLMMAGVLCAALGMGPDIRLNREVESRQKAIRGQLPDVLDLLTISVEAGLGFEQALDRTIDNVPGPLSDEFARMLGETRAGASRAEAMRAVDQRIDLPEVRSFVLAILQADTFGVSIGRVLRSQADEMRVRRRQMAQEQAQKAPVKMLIPMVFCVFPALFVIVIGPAGINISENL